MAFELKPLPFDEQALEPAISRQTVSTHYHKHHGGYVTKLNKLLKGDEPSLEAVIEGARKQKDTGRYNLAAQVWNHDFYWRSLSPDATKLRGALSRQIDRSFGSLGDFEASFQEAAQNEFGSGWTWLVWDRDGEKLEILSTTDAVIPDFSRWPAILTLDVWEHAYYLDYRQDRAAYIEQFLARLANWETAEERLALVPMSTDSAKTRSSVR